MCAALERNGRRLGRRLAFPPERRTAPRVERHAPRQRALRPAPRPTRKLRPPRSRAQRAESHAPRQATCSCTPRAARQGSRRARPAHLLGGRQRKEAPLQRADPAHQLERRVRLPAGSGRVSEQRAALRRPPWLPSEPAPSLLRRANSASRRCTQPSVRPARAGSDARSGWMRLAGRGRGARTQRWCAGPDLTLVTRTHT